MPDTKIYKAGDTVTATLTLEPGHAVPMQVWVSLDLQRSSARRRHGRAPIASRT